MSQKIFVFSVCIIYEPQEFPLEQLWYHDAVLFLSPAALISKRVSMLVINRYRAPFQGDYQSPMTLYPSFGISSEHDAERHTHW
jgi:hypothetical protein